MLVSRSRAALLPHRRKQLRHLIPAKGPPHQVNDSTGLDRLALQRIADGDHLRPGCGLQLQETRHAERADRAELVHHHDSPAVEMELPGFRPFEQHGKRESIISLDADIREVIRLAPRNGDADYTPAVLLPRIDQGRQQRCFTSTGDADRDAEPSAHAEPVDNRPLLAPMLGGEIQTAAAHRPLDRIGSEGSAAVAAGGVCQSDKLFFAADMPLRRDAHSAAIPPGDQTRLRAVLPDAVPMHDTDDRGDVLRAIHTRRNKTACGGDS